MNFFIRTLSFRVAMEIRAGAGALIRLINLKKTPLLANTRLDLFFIWLMKNYRKDTVREFCDTEVLDKITVSVMTNAARARDPDSFKESQTIPRVYYETCYSERGPYHNEHRDRKNELRSVLNHIRQIPTPVGLQSNNVPKPLYPRQTRDHKRRGYPGRPEVDVVNVVDVVDEKGYPVENHESAYQNPYDPYDNMNMRYM